LILIILIAIFFIFFSWFILFFNFIPRYFLSFSLYTKFSPYYFDYFFFLILDDYEFCFVIFHDQGHGFWRLSQINFSLVLCFFF
jgi:hypothetical protein